MKTRIFILFMVLISCGKQASELLEEVTNEPSDSLSKNQIQNAEVYFSALNDLNIHVIYEQGAEPYEGNIGLSNDKTWDITLKSYQALFSNHPNKNVLTPSSLSEMNQIANQNKQNWSYQDLVELGEDLALNLQSSDKANVSVIFLNGLYDANSSILGLHLTGYPFAFVFKDVVRNLGGDSTTQKYAEQATVVHEIGHTIGLVNGGVPMHTSHEDPEHKKHTTNNDCVMYWAVENSNDILGFLADIITGRKLNLFGTQSLEDGQNFKPN